MTTIQTKLKSGNPAYARKQAKEATRPDATPAHTEDAVRRYLSSADVDVLERHSSPLTPEVYAETVAYLTSLV